jgi:uncharacterized protein YgbK (DUF1537 family)
LSRVGVVADDFTGANDTAGRLASLGWKTYVSLGLRPPKRACQALIFNARTRFLSPRTAEKGSRSAWEALQKSGFQPDFFFQKIDSTLRGYPSAEIEGMLKATGQRWAAVVPAYPALGRTTVRGVHFVHQCPLAGSEYMEDPLSPPETGRVDRWFKRGGIHVGLEDVKKGKAWLAERLKRLAGRPSFRFATFDVTRTVHLDTIAAASLDAGCRAFAGASGLALSLGKVLRKHGTRSKERGVVKLPRLPKALVLAGTLSQTTLDQISFIRSTGEGDWRTISGQEAQKADQRISCLSTVRDRAEVFGDGVPSRKQAVDAIQRLVREGLRLAPADGLVFLTGGHTAEAFYEAAAFEGNWIKGDLRPGIPFGIAVGRGRRQWIATKPGGFGKKTDLYRALKKVVV